MSAYTPGRWRVQHHSDDLLNIVSDAVDYPIADLGSVDADDYPAETIDRLYADARLIAAALDMLEALQKIAQIQRDKCECADAETLFMILDNKVDIALAAIAKAEGRS